MKTDITVTTEDRVRLEGLIADRNTPAKVVWRAQIVLATADGDGTNAIMRRTGKSKPCVWRWQERFAEEGVDGLLRDKTRPPGKKPLSAAGEAQGAGQDGQRDAAERDALERALDGDGDGHQPHRACSASGPRPA